MSAFHKVLYGTFLPSRIIQLQLQTPGMSHEALLSWA